MPKLKVRTARLIKVINNSDEGKNQVKTARVVGALDNEINESKLKTGRIVKCRPNSDM